MVKTFKCKYTESLYNGESPKRFKAFRAVAERKLQMLDVARRLDDLRRPPRNMLEKLSGDRQGQWSIRINDQWRICFIWDDGNALDVEIIDYH